MIKSQIRDQTESVGSKGLRLLIMGVLFLFLLIGLFAVYYSSTVDSGWLFATGVGISMVSGISGILFVGVSIVNGAPPVLLNPKDNWHESGKGHITNTDFSGGFGDFGDGGGGGGGD